MADVFTPEKPSSLIRVDYLRSQAERADMAAFDRIMEKIPSNPPDPGDELPAKYKKKTRNSKQPETC